MKRILFLGLSLFDYDKYIIEMLSRNYDVTYVNTIKFIQNHKIIASLLLNVFHSPKLLRNLCGKTIMKDLSKNGKKEYDYVFAILGTFLDSEHVKYLKDNSPNAKYCMYLWDDWKRVGCPEKELMREQFRYVYSFDYKDCETYGFKFRPLFYINKENSVGSNRHFDISFIGTNHSTRYLWLSKIKKVCIDNHLCCKLLLIASRFEYIKYKLKNRGGKANNLDLFSTKSIPYSEYLAITRNSKCVVDFQHPSQRGLTMRTIESLALGVKVITTNPSIKVHSDIPSDMYMVLDDNNIDQMPDFVNNNTTSCLPERYSLKCFLKEIIEGA